MSESTRLLPQRSEKSWRLEDLTRNISLKLFLKANWQTQFENRFLEDFRAGVLKSALKIW